MVDRKQDGREPELNFGFRAEPSDYENGPQFGAEDGRETFPSEPFDFEMQDLDEPPRRRFIPLIVLGLGVFAGGIAAWALLGGDTSTDAPVNQIPMVTADQNPVRVRPDDPGGMNVPNRDKLVYERMEGNEPTSSEGGAERLLPPPEMPVAPPVQPPSETVTTAPGVTAPATTSGVETLAPPTALPSLPEPPPVTVTEPVQPAQPTPPVTATPTTPSPPTTATPPPTSTPQPTQGGTTPPALAKGNYVVQLASVGSQADAEKEWARLRRLHGDLLSSLTLDVQKADLGAKGVFYRVRGGMIDEASARQLCAEISKRKVGCIVAKK